MQVVIIILLFSGGTEAVPLDSFYKFGLEAGDTLLPPGDEGSSPPIHLNPGLVFIQEYFTTLYVSHKHYQDEQTVL